VLLFCRRRKQVAQCLSLRQGQAVVEEGPACKLAGFRIPDSGTITAMVGMWDGAKHCLYECRAAVHV
jgi:hypothetical protein